MNSIFATAFGIGVAAVGVTTLWCLLAIWFLPVRNPVAPIVLLVLFVVGMVGVWWLLAFTWLGLLAAGALNLVVIVGWFLIPASHRRRLFENEPPLPKISWNDDVATIENFRRIDANSGEWNVETTTRTIRIADIEKAWLGVQQFDGIFVLGHTFLSFGLKDGSYVGISIQSRRPEGVEFSIVAGAFKQYGLIYFIGDERSAITKAAIEGEDPLYLFPIQADQSMCQAMFKQLLKRAETLETNPEFYNTITNNCTNCLVRDLNKITETSIYAFGPRVVLSGMTGKMAYDHGLLGDAPFETIQKESRINEAAQANMRNDDFSTAIRTVDDNQLA